MKPIQVNARYIRSLRHVMPEDDERKYLNGVAVQCNERGKFYIATDGRILAAYFDAWLPEDTPCSLSLIIPCAVINAMPKPTGKYNNALYDNMTLSHEAGEWRLGAQAFIPVAGDFPPWRKVAQASVTKEAAQFDPKLLLALERCGRDGTGAKYFDLHHNGKGAAPMFAVANISTGDLHPAFYGLAMPILSRTLELRGYAAPEWLSAAEESRLDLIEAAVFTKPDLGAERFRNIDMEMASS